LIKNACDCHVHVFGPAARYPFSPDRAYTPPDASVEQLLALHASLGIERVVIVQPSPYGTDNSCTVDALLALGDRARGVAVVDGETDLQELHEAGVRGIRVNLHTGGPNDPAAALRSLREASKKAARFAWHVQLFTSCSLIEKLEKEIMTLPVPVVIDHFGLPRGEEPSLLRLVRRGKAYVKLSASHRSAIDVAPLANPERLLWGSDWPHPGTRGPRSRDAVQPFDSIDDRAALERLAAWFPDANLRRKILVDNPARLYDF